MTRTLSIAAIAASVFITSPAMAQERVTMSVPIADLDLSTRAGEAELDRRIERTVNRICQGDRACEDMAWDSAYDQAYIAVVKDRKTARLAAERRAQLVTYEQRPRGSVTVITLNSDGTPAKVETYDE